MHIQTTLILVVPMTICKDRTIIMADLGIMDLAHQIVDQDRVAQIILQDRVGIWDLVLKDPDTMHVLQHNQQLALLSITQAIHA